MKNILRHRLLPPTLFAALLPLAPACAQTHAVLKPEDVVRAVAVYEWTGDQAKPTASRIVPVSIFVDDRLQDAGIYLARPVPLALDTGTIFEVEQAGDPKGTLELAFARSITASGEQGNDDGWFGYGFFHPQANQIHTASKSSGPLPQIVISGGKGPHFSTPPGTASSGQTQGQTAGSAQPGAKPDAKPDARPEIDRSGGAHGTVSAAPADSTGGDRADVDPDSAENNPDRPTLRRRTPEQRKAAQKKAGQAAVLSVGSLNDDPDRPILHRGRGLTPEDEITPLVGLPAGMHQAVAVSDAKDRPEHDFHRAWDSDQERAQVLSQMQAFARMRLADYAAHLVPDELAPLHPAGPAVRAAAAKASPRGSAARTARTRRAGNVSSGASDHSGGAVRLTDEELTGYSLSYGGDPTFVYTASSPAAVARPAGGGGASHVASSVASGVASGVKSGASAAAAPARYVTIVAQRLPTGELKAAFSSATDSAHLDRTPHLLLVDAVDPSASNRASLLFELRAQHTRQFALYRVIGAESQQTFATDSIPVLAAGRGTTLLHH